MPTLRPGNIVVIDNLSARHVDGVRERIEATGAQLWYLPPYMAIERRSPLLSCPDCIKS